LSHTADISNFHPEQSSTGRFGGTISEPSGRIKIGPNAYEESCKIDLDKKDLAN
jgi:hypothetical protein